MELSDEKAYLAILSKHFAGLSTGSAGRSREDSAATGGAAGSMAGHMQRWLLVPKIWGSKFPCQVGAKLILLKISEVPAQLLPKPGVNPAIARFDHCVNVELAEALIRDLPGMFGVIGI